MISNIPVPVNKTILVVDDEIEIMETLVVILEAEGYAAVGARNGLEALAYLRSNPLPCLILLDWMMPVMNGYEFWLERQKDSAPSNVPIVIVSADGNSKRAARLLGTRGYVPKPIDIESFLSTVRGLVG